MSGYVGNLSSKQETALRMFKFALGDIENIPDQSDHCYLRWLREGKFNVRKTEQKFRNVSSLWDTLAKLHNESVLYFAVYGIQEEIWCRHDPAGLYTSCCVRRVHFWKLFWRGCGWTSRLVRQHRQPWPQRYSLDNKLAKDGLYYQLGLANYIVQAVRVNFWPFRSLLAEITKFGTHGLHRGCASVVIHRHNIMSFQEVKGNFCTIPMGNNILSLLSSLKTQN